MHRRQGEASQRVAVVLLNWNTSEETLECLQSLRKLSCKSFEVVIVDNASRPEDFDRLASACDGEIILKQNRNRGFAGGCNAGIRWALKNGFEYIWLLNNDTLVNPDSLSRLVEAMESDPRIGIAGGVMYYHHDPERIQMAGGFIDRETGRGGMLGLNEIDRGQFQGTLDVEYVSGGMLLVRADAIADVGLLDERFFMYYEDSDWGLRMRARNWRVVTVAAAKAWHKDKGTAGSRKPHLLQHGYLMFLYKNFRRSLPHACRLYARHNMRPHLERREWRLAWADALVYVRFLSRLAFVRPNLQP